MNGDTGGVYTGTKEIDAAVARGEKLTPVSERAAGLIRDARAARARKLKACRRRREQLAKASRRANRRRS